MKIASNLEVKPEQFMYHIVKYGQLLIYCILSILSSNLFALQTDKFNPVYLSADNIKLDNKLHKAYISGNIKIEQGSTLLLAHLLEITTDDKNNLSLISAKGNKNKQAYFKTIPKQNTSELNAWADTILYYPQTNIIKLVGNAKIKSDLNVLNAPLIVYDTVQEKIISQGDNSERIKIILHNEKKL